MTYLIPALQIVIALSLLNVWLLRSEKFTKFRGGAAKSLKEEFTTYGLPEWVFQVVRVLKVGSAIALLIGLWLPIVVAPAALVICLLMIGAIGMHIKVRDPVLKSAPALSLLILGVIVLSRTF